MLNDARAYFFAATHSQKPPTTNDLIYRICAKYMIRLALLFILPSVLIWLAAGVILNMNILVCVFAGLITGSATAFVANLARRANG